MDDENNDFDTDFVFDGEDLTWSAVARASGAYDPAYNTRSSRLQKNKAGPSTIDKGKGFAHASTHRPPPSIDDYDEELEEDIGVYEDEEPEEDLLVYDDGDDEDDNDDF